MGDFQILIVEDEGILAMNLRRLLIRLGYQVCGIVDNGETAIEMTKCHDPGLILMDIRLRGHLDGVQTAELIRRFSDVPILFTTAYSDEDTLTRLSKISFTSFLFKPYQIRDLHAVIESCRLSIHGMGPAFKTERRIPEKFDPVGVDSGKNGRSPSFEDKE